MRLLLPLLLLPSVSLASGYNNEIFKPVQSRKCYENARFPGMTCDHFFQYNQGKLVKMICPPGYSYYDRIGECSKISCKDPECINGQIESAVDNNRVVSCEIYAQCEMNQWHFNRCKQGTYFDFVQKKCVKGACPIQQESLPQSYYPNNNQFPGYGLPEAPEVPQEFNQIQNQYPIPEYHSEIPQTCEGEVFIPDRLDCKRFWKCNEFGFFSSFECPQGTVYNKLKNQCVAGFCDSQYSTICPSSLFLPTEVCGEFKFCQNNQWISGFCDGNRVFFNGRCIEQQCSNPAVDNQYAQKAECRHDQTRVNLQNPNQYEYCFYGKWFQRRCAQGQIFDWQRGQCIYSLPPPPPPQCQNGDTRDPPGNKNQNPAAYQECVNGVWSDRSCPYGFAYTNHFCVREPEPITTCVVGQGSGYRRVPHECTSYYQCDHGQWVKRPCAPGTFWHDAVLTCDWPANVPECSRNQFYGQ